MLVDQKMSYGDSTELSGMGIPRRAFMLVYQRNDMPGKSAEKLEEENRDVPQMLGLCHYPFYGGPASFIAENSRLVTTAYQSRKSL